MAKCEQAVSEEQRKTYFERSDRHVLPYDDAEGWDGVEGLAGEDAVYKTMVLEDFAAEPEELNDASTRPLFFVCISDNLWMDIIFTEIEIHLRVRPCACLWGKFQPLHVPRCRYKYIHKSLQ